MPYKCTLFYNFGANGWTESFYTNANDANPQAYADGFNLPFFLAALNCRANGVRLVALRTSKQPAAGAPARAPRQSGLRLVNLVAGSSTQPQTPGFPDMTFTSALLRLNTATGIRRFMWVRGIVDAQTNRDANGNVVLNGPLLQTLNAYRAELIAAGAAIRARATPVLGANQFQITAVAPNTLNPLNTDVSIRGPANSFALNQLINITRVSSRAFPGLNGSWQIIDVAPNGLNYTIPYALPHGVLAFNSGLIANQNISYPAITAGVWETLSEHKTGRPTFTPPGKRRAVIRRS